MTVTTTRQNDLRPQSVESHDSQRSSALVEAVLEGKARVCGIFGGQGTNNLTALDELRELTQRYQSSLTILVKRSSHTIFELASQPHSSGFFEDLGFDLRTWLNNPEEAPAPEHLSLAPLSFPINTLLSLAQYCITCQLLGFDPGQLRGILRGVTGHSQGLFAAVAVAKSDSWTTFHEACDEAIRVSFWVGLESHHAAPPSTVSSAATADCTDHGEGSPSSMLSISGLDKHRVEQLVQATNKIQEDGSTTVHVALVNSRDRFILAGPPSSLRTVCVRLRQIKAPDNLDQTRVLFHKRKPTIDAQFLPISAPYHSPYLAQVDTLVRKHIPEIALTGGILGIPVYHASTGQNLQDLKSNDLVSILVRAVTVDAVDWPLTVRSVTAGGATHILDFGPGQIGILVNDLAEGTGLRVIQMSDRPGSRGVGGRAELLAREMPPPSSNWKEMFSPRLVEDEHGITRLETKVTRLFGTPPVMVAGMTPTTVPCDFVAAVMDAGYHVELAGGGYWEEKGFEAALCKLVAAIPPGRGITCNLLYANPKTIAWQVSVLRRLAGDGIPIDGITIGAGIPSPEVVKDYIESIPGLRHISFKPGSLAAIQQVVAIAQEYPHFPIGLQWTGGRAGGHHSWEDFYQPILATYGRIRRCSNIVLIAGSGFGSGDDTLPFLTGQWARRFGRPAMPFDGVLLGSRMMVAKEAHTSPQAKDLIIKAEGVDDAHWHGSFDQPTGGVITVESEMGQPIHVLATRGMMLWKEFDQRIFSIRDKAKRLHYLRLHQEEIADRLNRDFFRPWFAVERFGRNIDLEEMTYEDVLRRLCQLMYVDHQQRWIDESYRMLVHSFIQLAHERFGRSNCAKSDEHQPKVLVHTFGQTLGHDAHETLYPEDVSILVASFRRPGQKPVPFIPLLDEHFETWFKKDSLWQSEDVDAVVGQDADRVCVIQGPVAVRYSTTSEESAKDILDSICEFHAQALEKAGVAPVRGSLSRACKGDVGSLVGVQVRSDGLTTRYQVPHDHKSADIDNLIGDIIQRAGSWAQTCLTESWIFRGSSRVRNPVKAAFRLLGGDAVEVRRRTPESGADEIAIVIGCGNNSEFHPVLQLTFKDPRFVTVTLMPQTPGRTQQPKVQFLLELRSGPGYLTIFEDPSTHVDSVKALYNHLWTDSTRSSALPQLAGLSSEFCGDEVVLSESHVNQFLKVINQSTPASLQGWNPRGTVPIDYCVVVAWTALTKPLMIPALDCNLLQLLHRSIRFRYTPSARPLQFGDAVKTFSRITALTIKPTGTLVRVSADIRRGRERVVMVETEFFIRGTTGGLEKQFSSVEEPELVVDVSSLIINALLVSRKWLIFEEQSPDLVGKKLSFKLTTHTMFNSDGDIALLQVSGLVTLCGTGGTSRPIRLGRVYFEEESCSGNPVIGFLLRHGASPAVRQPLEQAGWTGPSSIFVQAPARSAPYSAVSHDTNPIHTCPVFARYAGLDGTVVHGMHTSAIVRRAVEWAVGDADRTRFQSWYASFESMVCPKDHLRTELQHVAMDNGMMVLKVQTFNDETGEKVLDAEAEVEQPLTGYVFCGQGSQERGMGMSLYATRPEARALWDKAENYLREHYGKSPLLFTLMSPDECRINGSQVSRFFTLSGRTLKP